MEIFLRRVSTEDAEEACVLSNQLGYALSPQHMRRNIEAVLHSADSDGFVAVHDNRVVGWIGVRLVFQLESPPYAEISGLIVDHSQRKELETCSYNGQDPGRGKRDITNCVFVATPGEVKHSNFTSTFNLKG